MNTGKVLLGVLAGVAAGALLGILFAPDKGSDTRKKILKKGERYVGGIKDKFNDLVNDVADKFDDLKGSATDNAKKAASNTADGKV